MAERIKDIAQLGFIYTCYVKEENGNALEEIIAETWEKNGNTIIIKKLCTSMYEVYCCRAGEEVCNGKQIMHSFAAYLYAYDLAYSLGLVLKNHKKQKTA